MAELNWKIERYQEHVNEEAPCIESPEFYSGSQNGVQTRWILQLSHKNPKSNMMAYLKMTRCNFSEVTAIITVEFTTKTTTRRVLEPLSKRYDYLTDPCGSGWIPLPSTDTASLQTNKLLIDDQLSVTCIVNHIEAIGVPLGIDMSPAKSPLLERIWAMYEEAQNTDLSIIVAEEEFHVHKVIMRSASKVFDAMFEHKSAESKNNQVVIEDFDVATIERLIRFIYTGECANLKGYTVDAIDLLKCADKYDVPALKSEMEVMLVRGMTTKDAPELLHQADLYGAEMLKQRALDFIKDNAREALVVDYWKTLPKALIDEVMMRLIKDLEDKSVKK